MNVIRQIDRRLLIIAAMLLAAVVLFWSVRVIWQNTTSAIERQRLRSIPLEERLKPPFDLIEREIPIPGQEQLVLAPNVGTYAQSTVKGDLSHVQGHCFVAPASIAKEIVCDSNTLNLATYATWSDFTYRADIPVTLVSLYFGDDIPAEADEVESDPTPTPEITPTPAPDRLPWLSSDATLTMKTLLDYSRRTGRTGNFVIVDGYPVQHYSATKGEQVAFVWQHGDWIRIVSSNNFAVLENVVTSYPY